MAREERHGELRGMVLLFARQTAPQRVALKHVPLRVLSQTCRCRGLSPHELAYGTRLRRCQRELA